MSREREAILAALENVGREHSDATVLWHTAVADRVGIHPTDYKTMSLLQRRGPLTAGAIAEITGLATASVTALIDRLERRGFARRAQDPADRRRVLVDVTPEGVSTFTPFFRSPEMALNKLFDPYTVAELKVIHDFLQRSTTRLHTATADLGSRATRGPATRPGAAPARRQPPRTPAAGRASPS